METSDLLLVSVFAICKERLNSGTKIRYFSKSRIAYKEKTLEIRTFTLKSIFDKQILKKIFGVSNKKSILQQQIPPRLSTMRTTVGLRFL